MSRYTSVPLQSGWETHLETSSSMFNNHAATPLWSTDPNRTLNFQPFATIPRQTHHRTLSIKRAVLHTATLLYNRRTNSFHSVRHFVFFNINSHISHIFVDSITSSMIHSQPSFLLLARSFNCPFHGFLVFNFFFIFFFR